MQPPLYIMCHRPIVKVFLRNLNVLFEHPQVLLRTTAHQYFTREWCIKCVTFSQMKMY